MNSDATSSRPAIRFDRNELAGAFGDIGTDLPLIVGMILASGLHSASVLIVFGLMQIWTGLYYRIPMPVQPLKAVAVLVITQKLSGNILYGAGFAIGLAMLLLTATGLVDWFARIVPKKVVRGIQLGLGLQLGALALTNYARAEGVIGYGLAGIAFILTVALLGNRKYPAALFLILLGAIYAWCFKLDFAALARSAGFSLPQWHLPNWNDMVNGFLILALAQIPLSIGNSVLATRQTAEDFFPERKLTVRRIGLSYSVMNLVSPFLSGIPTCHGSGGMAGHYAFGARTGGSVLIYGAFYLVLGLFFSRGFDQVIYAFPLPILGVILLFEGLTLMTLSRDVAGSKNDFLLVFLIGLIAFGLPYGYLIGLVLGTALAYWIPQGSGAGDEKGGPSTT